MIIRVNIGVFVANWVFFFIDRSALFLLDDPIGLIKIFDDLHLLLHIEVRVFRRQLTRSFNWSFMIVKNSFFVFLDIILGSFLLNIDDLPTRPDDYFFISFFPSLDSSLFHLGKIDFLPFPTSLPLSHQIHYIPNAVPAPNSIQKDIK